MNEFLSSFSLVALAEIGDKTQLLSIILAARFRVFFPIFFGVLLGTIVNHAMSAYAGRLLAEFITPNVILYSTSVIFIILGLWLLVPDKEPKQDEEVAKYGAFVTSLVCFFIAEMGDKTQFATITLGAQAHNIYAVIAGTTLGMMAANIPAILFGEKVLEIIPLKYARIAASLMFVFYGIYTLIE